MGVSKVISKHTFLRRFCKQLFCELLFLNQDAESFYES